MICNFLDLKNNSNAMSFQKNVMSAKRFCIVMRIVRIGYVNVYMDIIITSLHLTGSMKTGTHSLNFTTPKDTAFFLKKECISNVLK